MNSLVHRIRFLSRFFSSPRKIGSITPSSKMLVDALLDQIPWEKSSVIVELGAGTGVVTKQIEQRKSSDSQMVIFESDPYLAKLLRQDYSNALFCADAANIAAELEPFGISGVQCIISCLPFNNFPPDTRNRILDEICNNLSEDGLFVAYQYSLQMKTLLQKKFHVVETKFVPLNLPPAFVYTCLEKK